VQDVMQDLIIILPSKWWSPAEHDIHYDSHRPVIALGGVAALQDLWRDVVRGTVWSGHQLILRYLLSKAEVDKFYMRIVVFLV